MDSNCVYYIICTDSCCSIHFEDNELFRSHWHQSMIFVFLCKRPLLKLALTWSIPKSQYTRGDSTRTCHLTEACETSRPVPSVMRSAHLLSCVMWIFPLGWCMRCLLSTILSTLASLNSGSFSRRAQSSLTEASAGGGASGTCL